jgi:prepilin-type N-terminal cleavage/methylation domain-containing protein
MFFQSNHRTVAPKAFGLVELMVSISIMAVVSTIIITRQSAFNGAVLLRNQAYEVAFSLREAQLLAVSGGDTAVRSYGVSFDTSSSNQRTYRIFSDANDNGVLDTGEQIGLTGRLDSRFFIREVSPEIGGQLTVIFTRPNFDARLCVRSGGCTMPAHYTSGTAYIDVARNDAAGNAVGEVRRVQVSSTGQISVVTY